MIQAAPDPRVKKTATGDSVCVAANQAAADAGAQILRRGGNAFDAAAAAGFMEAVIAPAGTGIGGYGASGIVYHAKTARLLGLDANTAAPAAARDGMFPVIPTRDPNNYKLPDDRHKKGPLSVGVPGVLAGLAALVELGGKLSLAQVIEPALAQARNGVELTPGQALTWLTMKAESEKKPAPGRKSIPRIVPMDDLAATLESIGKDGSKTFYEGEIGQKIADHIRALGGILSRADMAAYRVRIEEPITAKVGVSTLAGPLPSSGSLTSIQAVALLDRLRGDLGPKEPGSADAFHALIEVMKVVWEERLTTLTDSQFMKVDPRTLLSDDHLGRLLLAVKAGIAKPGPGRLVAPDPLRGTVHLAAADAEGNVVSWTQTHGGGFGSMVMVSGTGVVLGHGMCRFEPRTGWANSVAPGKRPLHNMCPVIALRDGKPVLAVGAAGARTIVNNVAAIAHAVLVDGRDAVQAAAAPRLQVESLEPAILEKSAGEDVVKALQSRGHLIKTATRDAGAAQVIARVGDRWRAIAEPRTLDAGANLA